MSQRSGGLPNILQLVRTTSLKVLGKPGATAGAGLAGGTTSGAPTTGQFDTGDAIVAQNGHLWICTVSGSPGTWVDAGASSGYTDPLTTRGDLVVRGAASTGRLALGTSGYILTSDGTDAAWAAAGAGFADPMTTRGDLIVRGGSGTTRLALGSSGTYLKSDGTDAVWAAGSGSSFKYVEVEDQKSQNTAGGTATSGSWQTRTLTTLVADSGSIASLASNQVTLPAGSYRVHASAPAFAVNLHQIRLQNITAGTTLLLGSSEYSDAVSNAVTRAVLQGRVTLGSSSALELQHRVSTTKATNGYGVGANLGTEVYSMIAFWQE